MALSLFGLSEKKNRDSLKRMEEIFNYNKDAYSSLIDFFNDVQKDSGCKRINKFIKELSKKYRLPETYVFRILIFWYNAQQLSGPKLVINSNNENSECGTWKEDFSKIAPQFSIWIGKVPSVLEGNILS